MACKSTNADWGQLESRQESCRVRGKRRARARRVHNLLFAKTFEISVRALTICSVVASYSIVKASIAPASRYFFPLIVSPYKSR
jgi:hypothetical protein